MSTPLPKDKRFIDLTGHKYGRLTVLEYQGKRETGGHRWLCKCECGNTKITYGGSLRNGTTQSCGCYQKQRVRETLGKHLATINGVPTKDYRIWVNMKSRCLIKSSSYYCDYGGRGITVCDRWKNSFSDFMEDMGPRPSSGHTLDRIDNNGNYEPSNCRWATRREQSNNTRRNRIVEYNGESLSIAEWARKLSLTYPTVYLRLKRGWSIERTLTTPQMQ